MHMMVGVPLDSKQQLRRCSIPRVKLVDRLVDTSCILLSEQAIVLGVVDQLYAEDPGKGIKNLEQYGAPSEHYLNCYEYRNM